MQLGSLLSLAREAPKPVRCCCQGKTGLGMRVACRAALLSHLTKQIPYIRCLWNELHVRPGVRRESPPSRLCDSSLTAQCQ